MKDMNKDKTSFLSWLVNPINQETFINEYWEKKSLIINREKKDYWGDLLCIDDIDHIISTYDLRYPNLRIVNALEKVSSDKYVIDRELSTGFVSSEEGFIHVGKVLELYSEGCTIVINHLERNFMPLAQLCRAMEKEFSMPFQTNIYLTPPNSKGFRTHYDTHDVFVMQISGSKKWRLYDRPIVNPIKEQDFVDIDYTPVEPLEEFTLHAGDIVYIPRGVVHDAITNNEESLHITFGAISYKWTDILIEALNQIKLSDEKFRLSLPLGFANDDYNMKDEHKHFSDLLQSLNSSSNLEAALISFKNKFISTRKPLLDGQLNKLSNISKSIFTSKIIQRPNVMFKLEETAETIKISSFGLVTTFPINLKESINFTLTNKEFQLKDIPGGIDSQLKALIIRKLIGIGILKTE